MSKTIIAVRHFGLGGRESLETAVTLQLRLTTDHCVAGKAVRFQKFLSVSGFLAERTKIWFGVGFGSFKTEILK